MIILSTIVFSSLFRPVLVARGCVIIAQTLLGRLIIILRMVYVLTRRVVASATRLLVKPIHAVRHNISMLTTLPPLLTAIQTTDELCHRLIC